MIVSQNLEKRKVLVFRSNIPTIKVGKRVLEQLKTVEGVSCANVDLEDWENILRVECSSRVQASQIECIVTQFGCECTELED